MNKVLNAIGHYIKNAAVFVAHGFEKIFGSDVAHNFAVAAEGMLKTALGQLAWVAVNEVEGLASGAEKKAAAFSKIASEAALQGISVKDSLINLLIEIAVQKLKGTFGAAANDPSAEDLTPRTRVAA